MITLPSRQINQLSSYGNFGISLNRSLPNKGTKLCQKNNNAGYKYKRTISGVKRVERRRMKDLREEIETEPCTVGKIVKSRMKWTAQMAE